MSLHTEHIDLSSALTISGRFSVTLRPVRSVGSRVTVIEPALVSRRYVALRCLRSFKSRNSIFRYSAAQQR